MNPSSVLLFLRARLLRATAVIVPLFLGTSCDWIGIEDKEPVQGEYIAYSSNHGITLREGKTFEIITLGVDCRGDHLPPGCETHQPMWTAHVSNSNWSVNIVAPELPQTQAVVSYNGEQTSRDLWLEARDACVISFKPSSAPPGMTAFGTSVQAVFYIKPEVEAEAKETAALRVFPGQVHFDGPGTRVFEFIYKGPDTAVTAIAKNGHPAFTLGPVSLTPVRDMSVITVTVNYSGVANADEHAGNVIVSTANGAAIAGAFYGRN